MLKKVCGSILASAMVIGSCGSVYAEVTSEKIRVFNDGAEIVVNVTGIPGETASVLMLDPDAELPNMNTDYDVFNAGVSHVDFFTFDEDGKQTFKYKADKAGIYNVYVRGGEIDYTSTNNEAALENPDRIYVESWIVGGEYTHPDLNSRAVLSIADIESFGADAVAKKIKDQLDKKEPGRRTIFLERKFSPYYHSNGEALWWDEGEEVVRGYVDEFFKEFSNIGGNVDFVYSDFETYVTMWQYTKYSYSKDPDEYAKYLELINKISSHEKYPVLEADLLARGYDKSRDGDIPLSSVGFHNKGGNNHSIFNASCQQIAMDYYTRAIYEPMKKYFSNVKYNEYKMGSGRSWVSGAANLHLAGTHHSPALYSKNTKDYSYVNIVGNPKGENPDKTKISYPEWGSKDYEELLGHIGIYRTAMRASGDNVMPWLGTEAVGTANYFADRRYRNEMVMHIAMHNPDRILHFNADSGEAKDKQSRELMEIIDEVNSIVGYPDRRNLNMEQMDMTVPFVISGMYTNGRNVWRITPDTAIIQSGFCMSAEGQDPLFDAGTAYVTFPQGRILDIEGTASDIGFWVETPAGVTPIIEYSDALKTDNEKTSIDFYELKYGNWLESPTEGDVFDAVASYKGFYGDKMNFIMAKYDENGMLLDVEVKECGIYTPYGNVAFYNVKKETDVSELKFFLWENGNLRPLKSTVLN